MVKDEDKKVIVSELLDHTSLKVIEPVRFAWSYNNDSKLDTARDAL